MSKNRQRRKRNKAKKPTETKQPVNQPESQPVDQGGNQGYTLNADEIEKAILDKAGPQKGAIERVVLAGMKVLFSKETSAKIFDAIRPDDDVPLQDELGGATMNLMKMLYNESKQSMPGEAIYPAGAILLAKACDFINRTKLAPITDNDYYEALAMFDTVLKNEVENAQQGQQQEPAPASPAPQQQPPQSMLERG